MKQSTKASLLSFFIAIILEVKTSQSTGDLRLFVGVFIVIGLAFMVYSFKESSKREGILVFNGDQPLFEALIKPVYEEYMFDEDGVYLVLENAVFINIKRKNAVKCFLTGIVAAVGGQRLNSESKKYFVFQPQKSVYVKKKDIYHLLESANVSVMRKGVVSDFYDKETVAGVYFAKIMGFILVGLLFVYVVNQMFK